MTHTLKLFNTGQITLPKSRRSKYDTKNFVAVETKEGLLIKPLLDDISFYEDGDGFGLYAPNGLDPQLLVSELKKLQADG